MSYKIQIHPDAQAELASLPKRIQRQVDRKICNLADNPRPPKAYPLHGDKHKGLWKLRSGDYRIIYQIKDRMLVVFIVMIGNRKGVYKKLKRVLSQP